MDETIEVKVWFTCTLQPRRDLPSASRDLVIQMQGKPTLVSVANVPKRDCSDAQPSAAVLWQAENVFLQRQERLFPDHYVIGWEARYRDRDGPLLSSFRVLLPAQDD